MSTIELIADSSDADNNLETQEEKEQSVPCLRRMSVPYSRFPTLAVARLVLAFQER